MVNRPNDLRGAIATGAKGASTPLVQRPRILVVEDEMVTATLLTAVLEDLGCSVVKARHLGEAVRLATAEPLDGACLDVNVAGKPVYPVADELKRRHIPFMFVTGHFAVGLRTEYHDCIIVKKPFADEDIARGLKSIMSETRGGVADRGDGKKPPSAA
jgi:CheY-like chemotaxis protein